MIIAALVFTGCQTLVLSCFAFLAIRWYRSESSRLRDEISSAVQQFFSPPDADTPSPMAVLIDQAALVLAARLAQQVKSMLAGVESGESKGAQLSMITEAAAGSPWMALLSGILPARIRNKLMKNPQMIGALSKLGNLGGNGSPDGAYVPRRHKE